MHHIAASQSGDDVRIEWTELWTAGPFRLVRENACGREIVFEGEYGKLDEVSQSHPDDCNCDDTSADGGDCDWYWRYVYFDRCPPAGSTTYSLEEMFLYPDHWSLHWGEAAHVHTEIPMRGSDCGACLSPGNSAACTAAPSRPDTSLFALMVAIGLAALVLSRGRDSI
jgi:hypothetical protein